MAGFSTSTRLLAYFFFGASAGALGAGAGAGAAWSAGFWSAGAVCGAGAGAGAGFFSHAETATRAKSEASNREYFFMFYSSFIVRMGVKRESVPAIPAARIVQN